MDRTGADRARLFFHQKRRAPLMDVLGLSAYGTGVTITIPKNERNNTNFTGCIDDKA
jgi:hypothetical protein